MVDGEWRMLVACGPNRAVTARVKRHSTTIRHSPSTSRSPSRSMSAPAARGLRGRAFRRRGARRFEDEAVAYAQVVAGAEDSVPAGQHELVVREHYPAARHVVGGAGAAARARLRAARRERGEVCLRLVLAR